MTFKEFITKNNKTKNYATGAPGLRIFWLGESGGTNIFGFADHRNIIDPPIGNMFNCIGYEISIPYYVDILGTGKLGTIYVQQINKIQPPTNSNVFGERILFRP